VTGHSASKSSFKGAVIDTGAQSSVIGLPQAQAYSSEFGSRLFIRPSLTTFKFGNSTEKSLGITRIVVPTPGTLVSFDCDVVKADIPLLIGLDLLGRYSLDVIVAKGVLRSDDEKWSLPLVQKDGHIFLEWNRVLDICYTREELTKIHRHFYHPSTTKLFNLLRRADPKNLAEDTRRILDDIKAHFDTCQHFLPRPHHFSVSLDPEQAIFNKEIIMDLMYLCGSPVLHVIDRGTTFSAARFLPSSDRVTVWITFIYCWASIYTGFPDAMLTDQGSVFVSQDWKLACEGV
jgi:hypothetical protein